MIIYNLLIILNYKVKQSASCSADSQCAGGLTCTNGRCLGNLIGVVS